MNRSQQQGIALILAIFVLVVVAGLATSMIRVLQFADDSVAREVLSSRALMAAESGLEIALGQIFPPGGTEQACAPITNSPFNNVQGLASCQVTVNCVRGFVIGGINYYELESIGQCGPAADPAVRRVRVQARSL